MIKGLKSDTITPARTDSMRAVIILMVKINLKIFIAQGAVAIDAIGNHIVQMMGIVVRESLG